jgi:hypothetical protein
LKVNDVSEEHHGSIFRVKDEVKQKATLKEAPKYAGSI